MNNKLSHSSASKFQECPTAWKFHYQDRLRSKYSKAALLFGSAIDAAITAIFRDNHPNPENVFAENWNFQDINGVKTFLPDSTTIVYADGDWDEELLTKEDIENIKLQLKIDDPITTINQIYEKKEIVGFDGLEPRAKLILNYMNWICLYRKGYFMIQTVKKSIVPKVKEVIAVQAKVELKNQEGDSIIGYADLVCRWEGIEDVVVLDFKTSSILYADDAVITSPQLTLYIHDLGQKYNTRKAGFIVLNKKIKKDHEKICSVCKNDGSGKRHKTCDNKIDGKRCNGAWNETLTFDVFTQVLIDTIPEQTENIVIDNMDYINQAIKNGVFHRNFSSCIKPWGKCPYFDKCYKGTDEGLVQLPEDKKK